MRQTFCSYLLLLLACLSSSSWSQKNPQLSVLVYNDAHISRASVERAEGDAARVFARAGLQVFWTNCPGGERGAAHKPACHRLEQGQVSVRIVQRSRDLNDATFGLAYVSATGPSRYCDVFYGRVQDLQQQGGGASASALLAHVLAHEIGHLLLGTNSHSATGIMRAQWHAEELRAAGMGHLQFTSKQAEQMREQARSLSAARDETAWLFRSGH